MITIEQQKKINSLVRHVSSDILFEEARERKEQLVEKFGKYASMKVMYRCLGCDEVYSARQLRSHKCPSGLGWKRRYPEKPETMTAA
jgi:hypothetical protein